MENHTVTQNNELVTIVQQLARLIASELRVTSHVTRYHYLKFPEDIVTITGGYIAESTVRSWKTQGFLKTIKIGTKTYVRPDDWEWFVANHRKLMAKSKRNRKDRLGAKNDKRK